MNFQQWLNWYIKMHQVKRAPLPFENHSVAVVEPLPLLLKSEK